MLCSNIQTGRAGQQSSAGQVSDGTEKGFGSCISFQCPSASLGKAALSAACCPVEARGEQVQVHARARTGRQPSTSGHLCSVCAVDLVCD